ncbi:MAG TPA: LysM peptidoglycan-binding domain-containing protein [Phycisphaerales bacterium]|nr:LysM peptidoglycan-binding domain-containing protein [Phycisphaerales bacterium]
MQDSTGRVVLGLLAMVAVWIGVYWWWPVDPPVSFAQSHPQTTPTVGTTPAAPRAEQSSSVPSATLAQQQVREVAMPPRTPQQQGIIAPVFVQHTIGIGETLETISKTYYGTPDHAAAILAANPTKNPPDLKPGRVINIPRDPRNVQGIPVRIASPDAAAPQVPVINAPATSEYVVQQGDMLGRIAAKVYGSSRHANLIYEANKDTMKSPNNLRVGQRLRIPPKPAEVAGETPGGN